MAAVGAKICGRWRRTMKKIMKRPSAADNKIKRPAAAPRRAASSGRGDTTEADEENWSDAETLIMGPPEKARKNMMKKPSAAQRAEASEDVPGKSPTLDREESFTEASEDELTSRWTPIGETC